MINFRRVRPEDKAQYDSYLMNSPERGCEYSFANVFMWGRQEIAFLHDCVAFFSHFYGRTLYPYPIGSGDKRAVVELLLEDDRIHRLQDYVLQNQEEEMKMNICKRNEESGNGGYCS